MTHPPQSGNNNSHRFTSAGYLNLTSAADGEYPELLVFDAHNTMSDDHFTVGGTLIQAWASQKSFRPKDGSDDGDGTTFMGKNAAKRSTNRLPTRDARLYKRRYGKESHLAYLGHAWWRVATA